MIIAPLFPNVPCDCPIPTPGPLPQQKIKNTFNDAAYEKLLLQSGIQPKEINKRIAETAFQALAVQEEIAAKAEIEKLKIKYKIPYSQAEKVEFNIQAIKLLNKFFLLKSELKNLKNLKKKCRNIRK
jgi:hypothetical protein